MDPLETMRRPASGRGTNREPGDDVRLLSDAPVEDAERDYFGFSQFARALAEILDNEYTATPLTVAVSGPWGAGKTSVAHMVQRLLEGWVRERGGARPRLVCWFNAWDHDDAPHLGAALAAVVTREAGRHRPWWLRMLSPLPGAMLSAQARWRRLLFIATASLAVAVAFAYTESTRELAADVSGADTAKLTSLGGFGLVMVAWLLWRQLFGAATDAARFVEEPKSAAARGSMAQVSEQLGRLIRQARRGGRIVIVIDDLERCKPERALEVFQVASQLLAHEGVATVLLADLRTLESAAEAAYTGPETAGGRSGVGRRYMEKLLQLEIELPPPRPADMMRLLKGEPPDGAGSTAPADDAPARDAPAQEALFDDAPRPSIRRRLLGGVERAGWKTGLVIFFGMGAVLSAIPDTETNSTAGGFVIVIGLGVVAWAAVRRNRRREREAFENEVETHVKQQVETTLADDAPRIGSAEIIRTVVDAQGSDEHRFRARKTAESYLTVHGSEIREVESYILAHPPPLPRAAKRMLNHARLLTRIALEREMFGGTPELTPKHLGEWIVMGERWPQFVERIGAAPAEMERLEQLAASGGDVSAALGGLPATDDLTGLLLAEPTLAPVIERLIRYEPAPSNGTASRPQMPPAAM